MPINPGNNLTIAYCYMEVNCTTTKKFNWNTCNTCRWEPPVLYRELFWTDENTQGIESHITAKPSKAWRVEWPPSLGQSAILFFLSLFVFLQPVLCFVKAALPGENLILLSCVHFLLKKSWNFSCTFMHFPFYTRQHNYSFLLFSIL